MPSICNLPDGCRVASKVVFDNGTTDGRDKLLAMRGIFLRNSNGRLLLYSTFLRSRHNPPSREISHHFVILLKVVTTDNFPESDKIVGGCTEFDRDEVRTTTAGR